jgi:hypothetical protein
MEIQFNSTTTNAHIKPQTRIQTVSESEAESTDPRISWPELRPIREDFIIHWLMHKLCTL